ncbi:protein NRT1/ PTR FAMILY 8.2 [Selaginella moellendorffii]|uniref:protein NRT1/ PTR FAMILY 8.2 n=1 Tax=Selaginella moellendorffii TaxID=88036 RepID=UPI000D1C7ADB|nr:protein NRT1/ PTR FAMILY 8.2 [Selaginella moellendorffii]|eukprot:XP_024517499.1 protein NRT1/ PTR FAMILY 8.2 [Selaginella moellendorffii]
MFLAGNEVAERMAFFGIATNFITFLVYKIHFTFPDSATIITNVLGTSCLTPLIGAFLADSYLGRYWTITIFSIIYLIGLIMLTIAAIAPSLRPPSTGCAELNLFLGTCQRASRSQLAFLYLSLYTVALGSGGIRPCVSAFGADQFDPDDPRESKSLAVFFNIFYLMIAIGIAVSLTAVVYIQDFVGWGWGLGVLAAAMLLATIIFLAGTRSYRHRIPSGSPLTRLAQVIVAAVRKRNLPVPDDESLLFEVYDRESAIPGSRKLQRTHHLRFLDKAAVETEAEKILARSSPSAITPWRLCTVTQVEELKSLARLVPIWATSILLNTVFIQLVNFSVQQGLTMDRRLARSFTIPAASVPVFAAIFIILVLPLYDRALIPALRRITGHSRGITFLQRIGIGLFLSMLAVVAAALIERKRRAIAYATGRALNPLETLPYSALWLIVQYSLVGLAEVFAAIGMLEFFYDQAPDSVRSVGTSFFSTGGAAGSYVASLLVTVVKRSTSVSPWLSNNINVGHLDRYYWMLAVLSGVNALVFMALARRYEYSTGSSSSSSSPVKKMGDGSPNGMATKCHNPLFNCRCMDRVDVAKSDRSIEFVRLV